jgi:hypothetical protein
LAGGWQQPSFGQHPVAAGVHVWSPHVGCLAAQTWPKQLLEQQSLFCWQASPVAAQPS